MPEPKTWQEKQAARPDIMDWALSAFHGTKPDPRHFWTPESLERMEAAIVAHEAATALYTECDEPGCARCSSCGWPVKGENAYRRTCFEHWQRD